MVTDVGPAAPPKSATDAFAPLDWALLVTAAGVWGASFLFIAVGLEAFSPTAVAFLRLVFGAAVLACVPRARRAIPRADMPRVALLGVVWMAVPLLLFPLAQRTVDSSVAGMLNGAVPVSTTAVAALLARRLPGPAQLAGVAVGFAGVLAISLPSALGAQATPSGVVLLVLAVVCYGFALNLAVPLQRKYGSLPLLLRAELVAVALLAIPGGVGLAGSTFSWASLAAVAALGCLGTALAFVAMTTLAGRVGAARGSVAIYLTPVVAIALGVLVRGESVAPVALGGSVLVLLGAYLASRREVPRAREGDDRRPASATA